MGFDGHGGANDDAVGVVTVWMMIITTEAISDDGCI